VELKGGKVLPKVLHRKCRTKYHPLLLLIRDGWGIGSSDPETAKKTGDATFLARTPVLDGLLTRYPWTILGASGKSVGLPEGQMGNSEVGHLNIGAGRIVYQELTRISKEINDGIFFKNKELLEAIEQVKRKNSSLHLIGLCSDGGVHSHLEHLYALLEMARQNKVEKVFCHALTDGRDTSPTSGAGYLAQLVEKIDEIGVGKIATICGRYYGMDRDNRWDRVEKAYRALVFGEGEYCDSALMGVENSYSKNITDEFIVPIVVVNPDGSPVATIQDNDSVIFFNFRSDRARQLTRSLTEKDFVSFERKKSPQIHTVCMTEYDETFHLPVAYPPEKLENILAEVLSRASLKQLRIAETEKYAHVTFFLNGGEEVPFPGEERHFTPSPKVATYDLKPEMSAPELTEEVLKRIRSDNYDFIVLNFANPDMVGHTGKLSAVISALEIVDACIGKIVDEIKSKGGITLITADHGNAEREIDNDGSPFTAHTSCDVHFILVSDDHRNCQLKQGMLADIAPTILMLLKIPQPKEMTGTPLF
jgi:2,3-bisphosphoglycerate-independent phosphoglycerate mutase